MEIKRLTITPIIRGCKGFTTHNPSAEMAGTFIKERMMHPNIGPKQHKSLSKLSRKIPSWINISTRVDKS